MRQGFTGSWNLSGMITQSATASGQTTNQSQPESGVYSFGLSPSTPSDIVWNTKGCDWAATVTTPESFTIHQNVCPPASSAACDHVTVSITSGSGTLTGDNLSWNAAGTISGVCDGSDVEGTIAFTLSGARTTH
jgi:hypothetical protein